jgi:hypothetical protein
MKNFNTQELKNIIVKANRIKNILGVDGDCSKHVDHTISQMLESLNIIQRIIELKQQHDKKIKELKQEHAHEIIELNQQHNDEINKYEEENSNFRNQIDSLTAQLIESESQREELSKRLQKEISSSQSGPFFNLGGFFGSVIKNFVDGVDDGLNEGYSAGAKIGQVIAQPVGKLVGGTAGSTAGLAVGTIKGLAEGTYEGVFKGTKTGYNLGEVLGESSGQIVGGTAGLAGGLTVGCVKGLGDAGYDLVASDKSSAEILGEGVGKVGGALGGAAIGFGDGVAKGVPKGFKAGKEVGEIYGKPAGEFIGASAGIITGATLGVIEGVPEGFIASFQNTRSIVKYITQCLVETGFFVAVGYGIYKLTSNCTNPFPDLKKELPQLNNSVQELYDQIPNIQSDLQTDCYQMLNNIRQFAEVINKTDKGTGKELGSLSSIEKHVNDILSNDLPIFDRSSSSVEDLKCNSGTVDIQPLSNNKSQVENVHMKKGDCLLQKDKDYYEKGVACLSNRVKAEKLAKNPNLTEAVFLVEGIIPNKQKASCTIINEEGKTVGYRAYSDHATPPVLTLPGGVALQNADGSTPHIQNITAIEKIMPEELNGKDQEAIIKYFKTEGLPLDKVNQVVNITIKHHQNIAKKIVGADKFYNLPLNQQDALTLAVYKSGSGFGGNNAPKAQKTLVKAIKENKGGSIDPKLYNDLHPNDHPRNVLQSIIAGDKDETLAGLDVFSKETDIGWIKGYFVKYTLEALSHVLSLRINDLQQKDTEVFKGIFIHQDDNNNIYNLLSQILTSSKNKFLVPLNLFNKHATGLIFEKNKDGVIQVKYLDSLNKNIPQELKQLIANALGSKLDFQEIPVEQQKYANCGVEVIENFILYLTGKRVSQEQAIELHSKLVENALLNIESRGVHKLFEEESGDNYSLFADSSEYIEQSSHQIHNFDYDKLNVEAMGESCASESLTHCYHS